MPLAALTSSFGSSEYAVPMAAHPVLSDVCAEVSLPTAVLVIRTSVGELVPVQRVAPADPSRPWESLAVPWWPPGPGVPLPAGTMRSDEPVQAADQLTSSCEGALPGHCKRYGPRVI